MDKEEILEQIEIIVAWIHGAEILFLYDTSWLDMQPYDESHTIDFTATYKLKPIRKETWCIYNGDKLIRCFDTSDAADVSHIFESNNKDLKIVHCREVL